MNHYRVKWEIDIDAKSPEHAARQALAIQRDKDSIATVFDVTHVVGFTVRVDITGGTTEEVPAIIV